MVITLCPRPQAGAPIAPHPAARAEGPIDDIEKFIDRRVPALLNLIAAETGISKIGKADQNRTDRTLPTLGPFQRMPRGRVGVSRVPAEATDAARKPDRRSQKPAN